MLDKMKQMMDMKKKADKMKKELESDQIEMNDIRGISIKLNGAMQFLSIEIDESFFDINRKERLQKDLLRALNTSIKKSQTKAAAKMKGMMPAGFPGL